MPNSKIQYTLSLLAALALLPACGGDKSAEQASEAAPEAATAAPVEIAVPGFATDALIDPNSASEEALAAVPGMSDAAVAAIIAGRPFATPGEMDAAIGDALDDDARKMVYALVFVKVGLNSGAEEDYKLIPSTMSPRKLAHEFEEYRPYESMEQFSREMSKYVSDAEVAYLERFVTLD
ncbi:MAG: hypothetical protein AAFN50_13495 [Pseudomonadota bacterium]